MPTTAAQLNVVFNSQGADAVRGDLESVGTAIDSIGKTFAVMGGAGVAAFGLMTNSSMQFTSAMANVNSIARLSASEMDTLSSSVLDMAQQFGAVPTDLADGLYDITSSGFEATEALDVLEAATVAAGAGLTSTATAAQAITAVLNAYGKGAEEAGDVSDVLFKTVDSGVLTFEELAGSLGRVLPIANSLNVGIEELGAAYAELTLQGISASEAETAIAAMMTAALNPTEAMTAAIEDYGYASVEALIASEGLAGYLEFLSEASGGTSEGMMDLLGNVRALQGALVLTNGDVEGFNTRLTEMEGAAQDGAYTLEVFGIQMDNAAGAVRLAQSELSAAGITMGSAFEPLVEGAARAVAGVVGAFNGMSGPAQNAIATFGAVASSVALFGGSLALIIPKVMQFRNALATLRASGTVFGMLAGSMGPLALGLGAVAAGAVYLHGRMNDTNEITQELEASFESLNQTVQQLKLGNFDEDAAQLANFQREMEGAILASNSFTEDHLNNEVFMARARELAAEQNIDLYEAVLDLKNAYELSDEGQRRLATASGLISDAFLDQSVNAQRLAEDLTKLRDQYTSGELTLDQYVEGVITVSQSLGDYRFGVGETTKANSQLITSLSGTTSAFEAVGKAAVDAGGAVGQFASEAMAEWIAFNEEATASILELTRNADYLSQVNLAGLGTGATEMAEAFDDAAGALDSVLAIFDQIDAMQSRMGQAGAIADYLFGPDGNPWDSIGPMRDVFDAGLISWEQFTAAIQDGIAIQEAAAESQVYLDKMRVDQLPILRETTEAYLDQIQAISELGAAEQLVALGWMDTGMQDRVQQFADLTNQLSALGPAGEAAMQQVVDGIVATDPVLTAMLENLGLIEQQANGDYTINMDAAGAMSEIAQLTEAIVALIDYMDNGLLDQSFTLDIKTEVEEPVVPPPAGGGGYTGAYWTPPWKVKPDVEAPEWPVWDIPQPDPIVPTVEDPAWPDFTIPQPEPVTVPVDADPGAAAISLDAFEAEAATPITKEITLSLTGAQRFDEDPSAFGNVADTIGDVITVTVNLQDNATAGLLEIGSTLGGLDGRTTSVTVTADTTDAVTDMNAVIEGYNNISAAPAASITVTADTATAVADLNAIIEGYNNISIAPAASITITADTTDAATDLQAIIDGYNNISAAPAANVTITADNSDAVADINAVIGGYNDLSGAVANVTITGDPGDALAAVDMARGALNDIDGQTALISILGDNSGAMGAIAEVQAYNGSVISTAYMDIVTRRSEVSLTPYAMGGYVSSDFQLVGERGPELVSLPYGSYVHTAGETSRMLASPGAAAGGAAAVNVTFAGDFYGSNREDLDDWAETSLVPSIVEALYEERRGQVSA